MSIDTGGVTYTLDKFNPLVNMKPMDIDEEIRKKFAAFGKIGGKKTSERYGSRHYSEAGKKSAKVRRAKSKKYKAAPSSSNSSKINK